MSEAGTHYPFRKMVFDVARQLGVDPDMAWASDRVEGRRERLTRFFPIVEGTRGQRGIWVKVTGWDAAETGVIGAGSRRRGRLTPEGRIAPFFEHVTANEGGY